MNTLVKFLVTFFCSAVFLLTINTFFLRDQEIAWGLRYIEYKKSVVASIKGPKLLFTGGSSALFSIRAETLEQDLRIPTVNLAVNGGFSLMFLLEQAKGLLSPGDTFLLAPEYVYLDPNHFDRMKYDFHEVRINHPKDLGRFGPAKLAEYILSTNIFESALSTAVYYLRQGRLGGVAAKPVDLNHHGDYLSCEATFGGEVPFLGLLPNKQKLPGFFSILKDFNDWADTHDVQFIYSFPPLAHHPRYDGDDWRASSARLVEDIRSLGVKVVGEPKDFLYPASSFCNSIYHLNLASAVSHTKRFGPMLKKAWKLDSELAAQRP